MKPGEKDRRENKKTGEEKAWGRNELFPRKAGHLLTPALPNPK